MRRASLFLITYLSIVYRRKRVSLDSYAIQDQLQDFGAILGAVRRYIDDGRVINGSPVGLVEARRREPCWREA